MAAKPKLFWDSSALIDAVMAYEDSPYRQLLRLGEAEAIDMRLSPEVMRDCEYILRKYDEAFVELFARLLHEANFAPTLDPGEETIAYCEQLTGYLPDARILAAAEECGADILVAHDRQHFLGNPLISPPDTRCRVKTAQESLEWCLQRLRSEEDVT